MCLVPLMMLLMMHLPWLDRHNAFTPGCASCGISTASLPRIPGTGYQCLYNKRPAERTHAICVAGNVILLQDLAPPPPLPPPPPHASAYTTTGEGAAPAVM